MLVFEFRREGWVIKNLGNGPALNVVVAQKRRTKDEWFGARRLPALARDGEFELAWAAYENDTGFGAEYVDFKNRRYSSIVGLSAGKDLTRMYRGSLLPEFEGDLKSYWET